MSHLPLVNPACLFVVKIESECRIVRGVNEEGEEFELRLGMCDLDVARGGLMVGPPAGSMSCEHNEL